MAAEVTITHPATGTVVDVNAHVVVIEITDSGSDPARELNVQLNAPVVVTCIAGAPTYTAPGYTVGVEILGGGVERYTITRAADWADPSGIEVRANYRDDGIAPGIDATIVTFVASTVALSGASPYPNQPEVRADTAITLAVDSTAPIQSGTLLVNGGLVLQFGMAPTWNRPQYTGTIFTTLYSVFVNAYRRTLFDSDLPVPVDLSVDVLSDGVQATKRLTYKFYTQVSRTRVLNPGLYSAAIERPFTDSPALEIFRLAFLAALRTSISPPPAEVLTYSRIIKCSLSGIRSQFNRPDLDLEASRLAPTDLAPVDAIAAALGRVDLLWEAALSEARNAGVDALLADLIATTRLLPYPQEQVGAVATLLFARAALSL